MKSVNLFLSIVLVAGICKDVCAQSVPLLERTITITLQQERLDAALKKIAQQGGFSFSYNPSSIEADRIVSHSFTNKTIREILDVLFDGTMQYKMRSKYIILTKAETGSIRKDERMLSGYVVDEATGERLKNVSIYDPVTLTSTITDSYGYFEIKIDKPPTDVILSVNKQNYSDTLVAVPTAYTRLLNIPIRINKAKIASVADSVGQKIKRFWKTKILAPQGANMLNVDDTLYRAAQFSVIPFVGTNHKLSGNVINDYSFNLFGGHALGVKKVEVAGIFNIDRGDVSGFQLAGTFNAVGGKVKGAQFAGVFNANYDSVKAGQFAGVFNFNLNSVSYFSAAGVFNFTRHDSHAFQLAGVGNICIGNQRQPHAAGVFNVTTGDSGPLQVAGSYNFAAADMTGSQLAGVFNFTAKNITGTQLGGVLNFTGGKVQGAQIASVLNYATRVKGMQVGLINITDSIQGVPLGLLSIVLKGYHKIEISADEIFYTNMAFRTGIRQFYNIITAGAKPHTFKNDVTYWTFGYGFGTAPRLTRWIYLNVDLTANQVVHERKINAVNLLNKLYVGLDLQASKKMSFTFGATLNGYITDSTYEGYMPLFTGVTPHVFSNKTYSNDYNLKMWLGAKVGVRFL